MSTAWHRMDASLIPERWRNTHQLWERQDELGDDIFFVSPFYSQPWPLDGGYYSVESALKAKGML